MANEIIHTIRHLKKTFTSDEWAEYCAQCRENPSARIVTSIGKYKFNDCDVCLNPDTDAVKIKGGAYGYSAEIKFAHCGNGVWAFGYDINTGTAGSSSGVSWADKSDLSKWNKGFESERECKKYAWRYILTRLQPNKDKSKLIERLYQEVEKKYKENSRPQIVQLELFD